jgi:hypothetical protein
MIKKLLLCLFLTLPLFAQENSLKLLDGNNNNILYSTDINKGLFVVDLKTNKIIALENDISAAYQAVLSSDGRFVLYKNIDFSGENSYQTPMLYDIEQKKNIPLSEPLFQCGVPSISKTGKISFMAGNELRILNPDLSIYKKIDIGNYANISAISPNGELVVLNDRKNQLFILNIETGAKIFITNGNDYYYEPSWSETGNLIAYRNAKSDIFIFNNNTRTSSLIETGYSLKWNKDDLYFIKAQYNSDAALIKSAPAKFSSLSNSSEILTTDLNKIYNSVLNVDGNIFYTIKNSTGVYSQSLNKNAESITALKLTVTPDETIEYKASGLLKVTSPYSDKVIARFDSIYFNQVYDCRIDRAGIGSGCCGAASTLMGLMFYSVLPEWGYQSLNKSYSPYANYLSEIYTFKGVTYNISYTRDAGGYYNTGLGIYGWIYRNSLEDTKGHMAELISNHGLQSSVDWSPTVQKAIAEVDAGYPTVVLNSLTTAGHYIMLTGYSDRVGTFVYNDPYGDANRTPYGRDKAIRIKYDYPGYSNGYTNLNTAWCFIYMRKAPDITLSNSQFSYDYRTGSKIYVKYQIKNTGVADVTSSFKVKLILSEDKAIDDKDIVLYEKEYSSLSLTDSLADSTSFLPPASSFTKNYTLFLVADADGKIVESTKSNNSAAYDFSILAKPTTTVLYPFNGSTTTNKKPTIYVAFDATQQIDTNVLKVYVNKKDITSLFQKYTTRILYYPNYEYDNGTYEVAVYLKNIAGYDTTITWSFTINAPVTAVEKPNEVTEYKLLQNYPNPFNPSTKISYGIQKSGNVKIVLYDASGKEIKTLIDEYKNSGNYIIDFNASGMASGTYLYRIITNDFTQTKKMTLIK